MRFTQLLNESRDGQRKKLKAELKRLETEFGQLPKNPGSQDGFDALDDYRDKIKGVKAELKLLEGSSVSDESELKRLENEFGQLPKNPHSQAGFDALDDYRDKIGSLKAKIAKKKGLKENAESADQSYQQYMRQIQEALSSLQAGLQGHSKRQQENPDNWGYVGDVENVAERLAEIADNVSNWTESN